MANRRSAAPIIAAVLLLLPVLYAGSYLACVVPSGIMITMVYDDGTQAAPLDFYHYRVMPGHASRFFWPLEQIDRRLRPGAWGREAKIKWMGSPTTSAS